MMEIADQRVLEIQSTNCNMSVSDVMWDHLVELVVTGTARYLEVNGTRFQTLMAYLSDRDTP
jgi:hypothetical protein